MANSKNLEIWKDIPGFEGIYKISNFGEVKSLSRIIKREKVGDFIRNEKILNPFLISAGYFCIKVINNQKSEHFRIHRLIAILFIPNPYNKPEVNHINGIRTDNRIENLEWVNERENCCHGNRTKNKSSQYVGVSFCKQTGKWKATIMYMKKSRTLGRFDSEVEAYDSRVHFENTNNITNKYI